MALRESLQDLWQWAGAASASLHLRMLVQLGFTQPMPAFKKLAQTIKAHWDGILAYYPHRITCAAIESINGIIQTARRRARDFRNFETSRPSATGWLETLTAKSALLLPNQSSEAPQIFSKSNEPLQSVDYDESYDRH